MANELLTSIHGRRFGLDAKGNPVIDKGQGTLAIPHVAYNLAAAGDALTGSSTETIMASYSIPANYLSPGNLIMIRAQGIVTAANSTDTFALKLKINSTVLWTVAATDATANDIVTGEYELAVRTIGATGTIAGVGTFKSIPAAEGTMTIKDDILASTTLDTTAAAVIAVTGTFSTTNAGNSARIDFFRVLIG